MKDDCFLCNERGRGMNGSQVIRGAVSTATQMQTKPPSSRPASFLALPWEEDPFTSPGPPWSTEAGLTKVTLAVRGGRGRRNPQRGFGAKKDLKLEADGEASKGTSRGRKISSRSSSRRQWMEMSEGIPGRRGAVAQAPGDPLAACRVAVSRPDRAGGSGRQDRS